jgi:hypothetical protein
LEDISPVLTGRRISQKGRRTRTRIRKTATRFPE